MIEDPHVGHACQGTDSVGGGVSNFRLNVFINPFLFIVVSPIIFGQSNFSISIHSAFQISVIDVSTSFECP